MAKAMSLGAMFLLLVIAVVILPIIVRYIDRMEPQYIISGFQDVAAPAVAKDAVKAPQTETFRMTENGRYLCNSPNGSGQSCPEGTFCDAATQSCIANYMGGPVPDTGYFA
jgi:hypothetical protein